MSSHSKATVGRLVRALAVMGTVWVAGCALQFDATRLGVPVTMASPAGEAPRGEKFSVNVGTLHLFWGLVAAKQPSLQRALAPQVSSNSTVADLKIKVHSRWSDVLLTVLTLGVIVPRTVTFEGVVVPATPPASP